MMPLVTSEVALVDGRQIGFKSFDMLRQVCHMSCDKDVSVQPPNHPMGGRIPKEEKPREPSQKIVLKCVSISSVFLSLPSLSQLLFLSLSLCPLVFF